MRERGQVGVKTICKGKSQGQGQDGGAKHGRDKGMLEVQDNNQANFDVQCSRGARVPRQGKYKVSIIVSVTA